MRFTLPMSTPAKRTGAPSRKPPALSKYDRSVIFLVNHPPVPLIRKIRTMRVALATTTVSPTRSCDHLSCFWLGKVVCKRQKHHNKHRKNSRILNRTSSTNHVPATKTNHVGTAAPGCPDERRSALVARV